MQYWQTHKHSMLLFGALAALAWLSGCANTGIVESCMGHCDDGVRNCGESDIDCGADCAACVDPCSGHCGNGKRDCAEEGTDCGGECAACENACAGHCQNDTLDCGESDVDCGGECSACSDPCATHCGNGIVDCGETDVDCGGTCGPCPDPCAGHCTDGIHSCGEEGVDCGGGCGACPDPCAGHCENGSQDCGEAGIDCGNGCAACPDVCAGHCDNGSLDCGETGIDCGGECAACPDACANHCGNGTLDCGETGVDCGGECAACPDTCANHCGNGARDCGETGVDCGGGCGACPSDTVPLFHGVNLAGAEFAENALPGTFGVNYRYPTEAEVDHFMGLGMNIFRLPFRWERLQRQQRAAFDADELARIDAFVSYATGKGAHVLLDPHNYARYFGGVIGSSVPAAAFGDFWSRLASHFKNNPRVIYGIMNEPNSMSTDLWLADANVAIAAIRDAGARQLIFVPGNAWSGAHSWLENWYGTANGTAMLGIRDPLNNYAIEVHQYLDANSAGTNMGTCVSRTIGSERLVAFTGWLAQHGLKGFLGEFGAGDNSTCLAAIDDMLSYMDARPQQWLGWTYWAAGPWWGSSVGNIEPAGGQDRPQTEVLVRHLP